MACEHARHFAVRRAFTLIEILAALTIVSILFSLAYPQFEEARNQANIAKAIGDLHAMSLELNTKDPLPESLAGIGRADRLDPWGRPYVYYKFPPARGRGVPGGGAQGPLPRADQYLL